MGISRYSFSKRLSKNGKRILGRTTTNYNIKKAVESGMVSVKTHILEEGERLDTLAALFYGESDYWWIIASASGIGWNLQVPPGTLLMIPVDLGEVARFAS